ncbi:MAG: MopE-related protein [Pseudomonadota bacterium]|nr:MopE-related protein [Pseudomonadota bacterium]
MRTKVPLGLLGLALSALGCGPDYKLGEVPARIVVTPDLSDFGAVAVGSTTSTSLTLTSVTGADVEVVAIELLDLEGAWFSVVGELPVVPSRGTATLTVDYTPEAAGFHLSQLTLTTDEEEDNQHVVDLRGTAASPSVQVWPWVLDFGRVAAGSTATGVLTMENDGTLDLEVLAATIDAAPFSVLATVPLSLDGGTLTSFTVQFAPIVADPAAGTLAFSLDAGAVPNVALRGNDCAAGAAALYDADADGYTSCATDCDDGNAGVHPGAVEVCDGLDGDCDGVIDEQTTCYDDDGDGASEDAGDCNDGDAGVSPTAAEIYGNGIDDDCDGVIDHGTTDADGDGYAAEGGDCDTADATIYPGAPELADGADNDCDGIVDEGTVDYDDDGDGITESAGDCDDTDAGVTPRARETADGIDNDCNGVVDEGTNYGDDDGDGFTEAGGDCDDADASVNPGAHDIRGDGLDTNCDGAFE